jgi:hypothetical protein
LAVASSANAQDRQYQDRQNQDQRYQDRQNQDRSRNAAVSLQINFGRAPHWTNIPGTRVRGIRQGDLTSYDMFRYGRNYYVYNNNNERWYGSRRWRGEFMLLDDRSVPRELRRIPRNNWRNYPASWEDRSYRNSNNRDSNYPDRNYQDRNNGDRTYQNGNDQGSGGTSATLQITFGSSPHWAGVSGTRVEAIPVAERTNYDVFRYGGSYYAYNDNQWYMSPRESGSFVVIDARSVPAELSQVPRENWRNYPAAWGTQNRMPPGQEVKKDNPPNNSNGQDHSKDHGNQSNGHGHN